MHGLLCPAERTRVKAVSGQLKTWLQETSEMGSGDDITALFLYEVPQEQ